MFMERAVNKTKDKMKAVNMVTGPQSAEWKNTNKISYMYTLQTFMHF